MKDLLKIIDELKKESSRNGKENILEKHKNNALFREVLRFVYNTYITTGLSTKKINKKVKSSEFANYNIRTISDAMKYVEKNNTGSDDDIFSVQQFLTNLDKDESDLAKEILTKSLKIGITAKTINKVYGKDEIPIFDVMLAHSYDKHENKVHGLFYLTIKVDGLRCICIKDDTKVTFYTRKGLPIKGLTELEKEMSHFPINTVLDGELILRNDNNLPSDELFRATQKVVRTDGEKTGVEFKVFDLMSLSEFRNGVSNNKYSFRREKMEAVFNFLREDLNLINYLPALYHGDNKQIISRLMKWVEENNYEGLMLNTADGLYQTKRTHDLLEIKKFKSVDLMCLAIEEGSGKNKGKLGAVLMNYKDSVTKVGSGFTDKERIDIWKDPDSIIGKICEIQYFEESMNEKTKQPSLRFPVFLSIREDKSIDDVNID